MPRHGHQWIDILQKERGQAPMIDIAYVPTMCNQCDNAPCLNAEGGGAVTEARRRHRHHRPGRRPRAARTWSTRCPYGHIWWNEELQLPQILAVRRPPARSAGWQQTRGQQACPTGAMRAIKVEDDEMTRMARDESLEVMRPEAGT